MKLLLINKNPVVSRMLHMSAPKAGFEVEECDNIYELPKGSYDVLFLDDEMYDENFLEEIKKNIEYKQIGLITSVKDEHIEGFDFTLPKPFLPTDLIELLRGIRSKIEYILKKESEAAEAAMVAETETEQETEESYETVKPKFIQEIQKEIAAQEENKESSEEEIIEIEERIEEEPFVTEEEVKESGVLDRSELEKVQELLEEEKEYSDKPQEEEIEEILGAEEEKIEEITESIEPVVEKAAEEKESAPLSREEKIKALTEALDLYTIRDLLDGMEITIKINFSKKKKKKR
ncbi:hypothetical protein [Nitrosophilus alvini]|uniref:hypothetical protein n=1 Tax=Nitrosophilus alvini TaxID=2714855 RepID=UPI001909CE5E|nr:hypothetical protein [Nitrosophilus alvini]